MTSNLMQKTKTSDGPPSEIKGFAIGEDDAHVFNCPSCARPLSEGTSKCPGCGVRLILGVKVKRAAAILGLGVALGVLVGGLGTAAAITLSLSEPAAAVAPVPLPTTAPAAVPTSAPVTGGPIVEPAGPVAALSALSGTAVVNGRIKTDAETLASTLARSNASATDISRALRSLAADAALGVDLAGRLLPWTDANDVRISLDDFYRDMASVAKTGLRASLADVSAYREAGRDMLVVLERLGTVDAQSRTLAEAADLELPPVASP